MEEYRETTTTAATTAFHDLNMYSSDIDSTCSTPYVSAPSSPGRIPVVGGAGVGGGFFYSAPTSPMHYMLFSPPAPLNATPPASGASVSGSSFEFDFSARFANTGPASDGSMISADELFCNGQIRPMKLSTHLQRPQVLAPLLDLDETEDEGENFLRGRDVKWRDRSLRRRTRSMSPLRSSPFGWHESYGEEDQNADKEQSSKGEIEIKENEAEASSETTPSASASSSRSSSVSRSSKRWVFLKEFLYRSKSEGRNTNQNSYKFWTSVSFSPVKDKKVPVDSEGGSGDTEKKKAAKQQGGKEPKKAAALAGVGVGGKPSNGLGKRRGASASAHELHYKANREKAEEMRKKTFLPYRQGLLGCLGFSSKSYGAMNGFARSLNPVSSR
ncbi:hypothetical protein RHSIM_Rhsim11G0093900 [Rhododendron simsii]|uniref:Uncharacterized protein n=1 Tax=Rhododendron simsii TaxID=118357 RepID=A0A834GAY1_RHOSS|nr:hypothetical protein RHSIM_Rhsim11G0093900 [Rhododendron simsii]